MKKEPTEEERKKEAKYFRDKFVLESTPNLISDDPIDRNTAIIYTGVSPENYDRIKKGLTEKEFKAIAENPLIDIEAEKEKAREKLIEIYRNIKEILHEYCDLREDYYNIIALWIIGTYLHEHFPSYPYLFFNAMRGSGKTRILKLITYLAKDGCMLNSLTEAVLFRTKGTLAIDEFEGISRKGMENLRELLNSAYKKGIKVKRMRKSFGKEGEQQVVEEFDVYRPIILANISGMENVLSDRCLTLILEKSSKTEITNLIELFDYDERIRKTREMCNSFLVKPDSLVSLVSMSFLVEMYRGWNSFITYNNTNTTNNTNNTNNINDTNSIFPYKTLKSAGFNGRELELSLPLVIISNQIGEIETTLTNLSLIMGERRMEDLTENNDISFIDFVSQQIEENRFVSIKEITRLFREFLQSEEDWINNKWIGRALKRLNLVKDSRRKYHGREVILNITKAQEKIKMFR